MRSAPIVFRRSLSKQRDARNLSRDTFRTQPGSESRGETVFKGHRKGTRTSFRQRAAAVLGQRPAFFLDMDD